MQKAARHSIAIFATVLLDQWQIWYQLDYGVSCSATLIRSKIRLKRCNQALQMGNEIMMKPVNKCSQSTNNLWNKRCHLLKFTIVVLQEFYSPRLWFQLKDNNQSSTWKKKESHCDCSLAFWLNITCVKKVSTYM